MISYGSLQHTGDNVISVMEELDDTREITDSKVSDHVVEGGSFIFYDMMGLAFVFYSTSDGIIINSVVILASIVVIVLCLFLIKRKTGNETFFERRTLYDKFLLETDMSYLRVSLEMITAILIQVMSLFCASCFILLLAMVYDLAGRPLSFFANTWLLYFNYYIPFVLVLSLGPHLYIKWREKVMNFCFKMSLLSCKNLI